MNIVLNEISDQCTKLVEYLTSLPDISLYLAVSNADTLRIIHDNNPEAVIFCKAHPGREGFVQTICQDYPALQIYAITLAESNQKEIELIDLRTNFHVRMDQLLPIPAPHAVHFLQNEDKIDINNHKE
jgi:hypothetical protein